MQLCVLARCHELHFAKRSSSALYALLGYDAERNCKLDALVARRRQLPKRHGDLRAAWSSLVRRPLKRLALLIFSPPAFSVA